MRSSLRHTAQGKSYAEPGMPAHPEKPWQLSLSPGEPLNENLFRRAWEDVFKRHDILNASFHLKSHRPGGGLMISEGVQSDWKSIDWQSLSPQEISQKWNDFQKNDQTRPFALENPPLSRVSFIRLPGNQTHILWSFPEILLDEFSLWQILEEVLAIYEIRSRGEEPDLTPAASWKEMLEVVKEKPKPPTKSIPIPLTTLPFEQITNDAEFHPSEVSWNVDPETIKSCEALAKEWHIPIERFVLAAWVLTLGRLNASEEVCFEEIKSRRSDEALPLGRAIDYVVHHVALDPGAYVRDWMRSYPEPTPIARLKSDQIILEILRENGAGTLADHMPRWIRADAVLKRPTIAHPRLICRLGNRPSFELFFDASRFPSDRAEAVLAYLHEALRKLTRHPTHLLCQLGIVPEEEVARILKSARGPVSPATLRLSPSGLMREAALFQAGRNAIETHTHTLSYDALHLQILSLGSRLKEQKLAKDSLVGVSLAPSPWLPLTLLSLWSQQLTALPLTKTNIPAIEKSRFRRDRPALILFDTETPNPFSEDLKIPSLNVNEIREGASSEKEIAEPSGEHRAIVLADSGVEGLLTSAEFSGGALCNLALAIASHGELNTSHRILAGPHFNDPSLIAGMLATFSVGATLVFSSSHETLGFLENLSEECDQNRISVLLLSAKDFHEWAIHLGRPGATKPSSLIKVIVFGDTSDPKIFASWEKAQMPHLPVLLFWSPSPWILPSLVRTWLNRDASDTYFLGRPLSNASTFLLEGGHLLPEGVPGELILSGYGIPKKINLPPEDFYLEEDPLAEATGGLIFHTGLKVRLSHEGIHLAADDPEPSVYEETLMSDPSPMEEESPDDSTESVWEEEERTEMAFEKNDEEIPLPASSEEIILPKWKTLFGKFFKK